jgi:murein DD-endopeptidase MepM/ murein hydrolase activator NlpD
MFRHSLALQRFVCIAPLFILLLISACTSTSSVCPEAAPVDLTDAAAYASDESLPFRFPLDDDSINRAHHLGWFCTASKPTSDKFHAAEDYIRPAGTPVYAIADGRVSFSGRMGGYGWLVIVDHPQANLYSLYGHLSPSRWQTDKGLVKKGDLLGYLGDEDENGGSAENPMEPHLHLGIRAGQRIDYPGGGAWRWMAGWIGLCPRDVGWLQPSVLITSQEIPPGGYSLPQAGLIEKWGIELLLLAVYFIGAAMMLIYAIKQNKPNRLFLASGFILVASFIFRIKSPGMGSILLGLAILLAVIGAILFTRQKRQLLGEQT